MAKIHELVVTVNAAVALAAQAVAEYDALAAAKTQADEKITALNAANAKLATDLEAARARIAELEGQQTPTDPPVPEGSYKVVSGDTLFSIAQKFNVTVDDLKRWNSLTTTTITAGQILKITGPAAPAPEPTPTPTPTTQVLWGSSLHNAGGETPQQMFDRTNNRIGPLGVVRYFVGQGGALNWPSHLKTVSLHYSFKFDASAVLAGTHDAAIKAWLAGAPAHVTYWTYYHEPEDNFTTAAAQADYRNAWRRIYGLVKASGKNMKATLTLMEWTLNPSSGRNWKNWYPGADVVDVLGWDAYHGRNRTPDDVYKRCRAVSLAENKPWAIGETGVAGDMVPVKTERMRILTALAHDGNTVKPLPVYICYFDNAVGGNSTAWPITDDAQLSAAWVAGRN